MKCWRNEKHISLQKTWTVTFFWLFSTFTVNPKMPSDWNLWVVAQASLPILRQVCRVQTLCISEYVKYRNLSRKWKMIQMNCRTCITGKGIFQKWAHLGLFFVYFRLFKHTLQNLQQKGMWKCASSIRCRDSNSQHWIFQLICIFQF